MQNTLFQSVRLDGQDLVTARLPLRLRIRDERRFPNDARERSVRQWKLKGHALIAGGGRRIKTEPAAFVTKIPKIDLAHGVPRAEGQAFRKL